MKDAPGTPVLVTGGAGYIGSHACKLLRQAGYTSYRHKLAFLERLEIQREQRVQLLLVRGMRLF
jgi:nucleoside-diphosphate-sugar epimerase